MEWRQAPQCDKGNESDKGDEGEDEGNEGDKGSAYHECQDAEEWYLPTAPGFSPTPMMDEYTEVLKYPLHCIV